MTDLSQAHPRSVEGQAGPRGEARAPLCEEKQIVGLSGSSAEQLQGLSTAIAGCKLGAGGGGGGEVRHLS